MKKLRFLYAAAIVVLGSSLGLSSCDLWNQLFPPNLVGLWRQDVTYTNVTSGYPTQFRFQFQFNADKTMEMDVYVVPVGGTQYVLFTGSQKGTYSVSNDIISITITELYTVTDQQTFAGTWSAMNESGTAQYSINGTTMTLTPDVDKNGQYDTTHPVESIYPGGGSGPTTDFTLTLQKVS